MKKYLSIFLLSLIGTFVCGCSFHSYQAAITEIKIPHYRKPDSLAMVNEDQSVASLLFQEGHYKKNG